VAATLGQILKMSCVLAFKTALVLLKLIWWLLHVPPQLVIFTWKCLVSLCRFIGSLTIVRKISAALNWIGGTRLVMIPLSIVMLLLRGIAMGLGIIWGLQSQRARKGHFSQVLLVMIGDIAGVTGAFFAAFYTRVYLLQPILGPNTCDLLNYTDYLPFVVLFLITVFYLSGLYKPYRGLSQVNEFALMTKSVVTTMLILIVILYLRDAIHSKAVVLLSAFYSFFLITALRFLTRRIADRLTIRNRESDKMRVLIVGTGEVARLICQRLQNTADIDTLIVGMLDKDAANVGKRIDGYDVVGSLDDLASIIHDLDVHEVFVALPMMSQQEVMDLVDKHSGKEGVHFYLVSNLFDLISAEIDIAEHSNIPIACLRNEQMALVHMFIKRAFDIVVSTVVILLTFPFWILIMIAIRLETDGPAIFKQERVGLNGKIFKIRKFRTMRSDVDKYEYSPSSPDDGRITKVGAFLRKTSLDEFPQFLNVLNGDMSMVGPRPEMPFIVEKYKDWERQRLKVKPGLTGLWQIMGRKDLPLHESLEYDFYYIKNQSLLLDLTILIKTIPIILLGKGAY
jgi:exopolysaccharide biosynthesis polyprenyl glycosylphosphotransferase